MNTHAGYSKKTLTDTSVLLAGGGDKSLADFLGGIQYVSASNKIQYRAANTNTWTDLVTLIMTDENVKQTPKTDNVNRPLMMINGGTSTGTLTSTSMFSTGIYANASTKMITANGFVKTGSNDTYVLLGGGGHKLISDFAISGHNHNDAYVKLFTNAELTINSSVASTTKGVLTLWRSSGDHYSILGFSNGATETYLGGIGFKKQSDSNLYRFVDGALYKIWDSGNDGSDSGLDADTVDGKHLSMWFKTAKADPNGKSDKPYHLVAEYVSVSANTQLNFGITLLVRKFYPSDSNYSGILIIRCRYEKSGTSPAFCSASWALNNGLSTSNFIIGHKRVNGIVTVRLYAKITGWGSYCFSKLDEGGWSTNEDDWSLYNATNSSEYAMASIPSDETQVTSQLVDISNRAASAIKLSTSRTINGSSFDGTANITIAPSLLISGNTIASQVGNLTSSYITVPYASNADTVDNLHATDFMRHYNDSSLDADSASQGWHDVANSITNAALVNHSALIHVANVGTPFQLQIPDAAVTYIFKRYYSNNSWSDWSKISAGYADSAGYAHSAGNADTVDGYHAGIQNGQASIFVPWPSIATMQSEGLLTSNYGTSGYGHPDEVYLQAICKWAIAHYTNLDKVTLIGSIEPNSSGTCIMHLYSSSGRDSTTLLPRYCTSLYQTLGGQVYEFGCVDYVWYYRAISAGNADTIGGYYPYHLMHYGSTDNSYDNQLGSQILTVSGINPFSNISDVFWGSILLWSNTFERYPNDGTYTDSWYNLLMGLTNDLLYFRTRTNGNNWTSWKQIAFTSDLSGYLPLSGGTISNSAWGSQLTLERPGNAPMLIFSKGTTDKWFILPDVFDPNNKWYLIYRDTSGVDHAGTILHTDNITDYLAVNGEYLAHNGLADCWTDSSSAALTHPWYGLRVAANLYAGYYSTTLSDYWGLCLRTGISTFGLCGNGTYGGPGSTPQSWGTLTSANGYTSIALWADKYGGEIGVASYNGQMSVQVDGCFYQREGLYKVLDEDNVYSYAASALGTHCLAFGETTNQGNYIHIGWIDTNSGYLNFPFILEFTSRYGNYTRLTVRFVGQAEVDPNLESFNVELTTFTINQHIYYIVKTLSCRWDLYAYLGWWEHINLYRTLGARTSFMHFTMDTTDTLPSGATQATRLGWYISYGTTGWKNNTYGGGIYMQDSYYIRTYGNKLFYVGYNGDHAIYTAGGFASSRLDGNILALYYNNTWYTDCINTHGNGNMSISPPGDSLFLGYARGNIYFMGGTYYMNRSNGSLYMANFYTTSDLSKKQNISSFSEHIRKFQLKDTEKWHYGVIAQEVPEMFRDGEEGNMTVNYNSVLSFYIGLLENRVKELEDKLKKYEEMLIKKD